MKIHFSTLGCKVNQYESFAMRAAFESNGHVGTEDPHEADVIVVNSCTVTAESNRKTRQLVRKMRRSNPNACIVLTGCMPQAFPKDAEIINEADIVTGNKDNNRVPEMVYKFLSDSKRTVDINQHRAGEAFVSSTVGDFHERTRAYVKVEDGCDRFCTYCIIPKARGRVRSKSPDDIRSEAAALSASGYKELVLVGINLSDYGKEIGLNMCDAVDAANVQGIERIRLGSLEPDQITDKMISHLSSIKEFCPQFHLSLQSGCDRTLRRMNRHYDSSFYRNLVTRLRNGFENCSITTDIMVGFAGETDEDFEDSLKFVDEIGFAKSHVFAYSRRAGTPAATYPDQVPESVKRTRSAKMIETTVKSTENFLKSQIGLVCPVLFEGKCEDSTYEGYAPNYTPVRVRSDKNISGLSLRVKITDSTDTYCTGVITE
ncbi:MAG: tRNA (N(6)-L-threonylcarbamoyladenosine(37)-C(2))-methylthiotransferase MtaB [Clostridia bacterium]|nr:tRNA (N(6)-L-threonylcarbamoyladenosine(37)-C(2))-methylthiotransferase MtaB [Clostridia bacterium]